MIQIYELFDTNHNKISPLPYCKDVKIERELSGLETLSFSYPQSDDKYKNLKNEAYIRTENNEYVIKEVNSKTDWTDITARVNTEDLYGEEFDDFEYTDTLTNVINLALAGTGWTIGFCDVTKVRHIKLKYANASKILDEIRDIWNCEIRYDAINKKVNLYESMGEDKGVYFVDKLNLKELSVQGTTYDFITRLIPLGKDIDITTVNNGLRYIENNQYSTKVITGYWRTKQYTDPQALKEDAEIRLEKYSKPVKAYKAMVIDLAAFNPSYSILSYDLGDTITLQDSSKGVNDKVRIVKTIEYPLEPEKNEVEIANRLMLLQDMQISLQDSADTVDAISNGDGGSIDGTAIDGISQNQITDLSIGTADIKDASITNAKIGAAAIGTANIQDAAIVSAKIGNLQVTNAKIANASIDIAKIKDLSVSTAKIQTGAITTALIDVAAIGTTQIADGSITDAKIVTLTANKITAGTIDAANITVVNLNAANITVGKINGVQIQDLAIGTGHIDNDAVNGDKLAANAVVAEHISAATITGSKLVADTITAREIAASTITATQMVAGTITAASGILADAVITTAKIGDAQITNAKIASLDAGKITTGFLSANKIKGDTLTLGGSGNTNGIISLLDASGGEVFRGDSTGVTVTGASYKLKDGAVTYDLLPKNNLLNDHSFEMILATGSRDATHGDFAIGTTTGNYYQWNKAGNPRLVSTFQTGGGATEAIFGLQAVVADGSNYLAQYIDVKPNTTYTFSGYAMPAKRAGATSCTGRLYIQQLTDALTNITSGTKSQALGVYSTSNSPTRVSYTITTGATCYVLRVLPYSNAAGQWVIWDGMQLVEGDTPSFYEAENQIWAFMRGWYASRIDTAETANFANIPRMESGTYWGMMSPTGATNTWFRTSQSGFIPYASGGGSSSLGTSSWPFTNVYAQQLLASNYFGFSSSVGVYRLLYPTGAVTNALSTFDTSGREIMQLRAKNNVASGAGINLYSDADPTSSGMIHFYTNDGIAMSIANNSTRTVNCTGSFTVSGTKSCIVDTESYGKREMYALETPDNRFCTIIEKTLTAGEHWIDMEPMFAETINGYTVMPVAQDGGQARILEKQANRFRVKVTGGNAVEIHFFVYGKRTGFEDIYMKEHIEEVSDNGTEG